MYWLILLTFILGVGIYYSIPKKLNIKLLNIEERGTSLIITLEVDKKIRRFIGSYPCWDTFPEFKQFFFLNPDCGYSEQINDFLNESHKKYTYLKNNK